MAETNTKVASMNDEGIRVARFAYEEAVKHAAQTELDSWVSSLRLTEATRADEQMRQRAAEANRQLQDARDRLAVLLASEPA
jgi:hypothetical protein